MLDKRQRTDNRRQMASGFFQEFNDMFLKGAEIAEFLEIPVDFIKIYFEIFMDKQITQSGHRQNTFSKIPRDNAVGSDNVNCFSVVTRPLPIIRSDYVLTYVKERLYADL